MDKPRFSMLLLEPGEIYFEDFSCSMSTVETYKKETPEHGRLKLCSKSLVFEPRNWERPLIKMHFRDSIQICIVTPKDVGLPENTIKVAVKQFAEMLAENILAPYKFKYEIGEFFFCFDFAVPEDCLRQMQQLQRASTLHAPDHNSMVATISHSRYMRMSFDPVMMDDFSEEIVLQLPAEKISPLVRNPGKLALTATTLYFQPFNNTESTPVLKLKLQDLRRIFKRRFLLRQVGLEIYCKSDCSVPHLYLAFQNERDRNTLYNVLEQSTNVSLEKVHAEEIMLQWQNGIVSNYDYLTYLNCLADRSKNDLTQYPVFPWVLTDYRSEELDLENVDVYRDLSKPMGALNPERLAKLKERYEEMSEPKFLFGSHYSAPGLVLFYLVRKYPQYMLCLQNGRFDHPDRMFNAVADVFKNCLKNMSDFKELLPEFYDTDSNGDFLMNMHEIDFGERHDGTKVNDVVLPPWAESPEHFVRRLRDALESEYVSRHLHLWIDLMFGYRQRGEQAVKANNVFHHVCYEGSVDLECIYDINDRHALEVQIMEFGQVPKQLFRKPHVRRITHQIQSPLSLPGEDHSSARKLECVDLIQLHREDVTCVVVREKYIVSVGKDGVLKVYNRESRKQIRSVALCTTPLSSCVMIDDNTVAAGSWDNEIYLYNVEYGRLMESFRAHDDSVSCLMWLQQEQLLVSGGWDCMVRAWGSAGRNQALRGLRAELDHDGKVTALTLRRRPGIDIISGTSDGEVYIWNLSSRALLSRISVHASPLTGVCFVLSGDRLVSTSEDGDFSVTDLTVSHAVFHKRLSEAVTALSWDGTSTLWLGGCGGTLLQWNMMTVSQLAENKLHDGAINSIYLEGEILVTGSSDKSLKVWELSKS